MISSGSPNELLQDVRRQNAHNKAFERDKVAVSQLLQKAQKLRHSKFAPEQRR